MRTSRSGRSWRRRVTGSIAVMALVSSVLTLAGSAPANADTTASTGDESVSAPAGWLTLTGQTTSQISSAIGSAYRLVDVHGNTDGTFTVSAVRNSGAYAVPGWWWYVNQ